MKNEKIGTIFLIIILSIAGIGISYAGLTDTIHIYGTVDSATVTIDIEEYSGTDVWKVWNDVGVPPGYPDEVYIWHGFEYSRPTEAEVLTATSADHAKLIASAWAKDGTEHNGETYDVDMIWDKIFPCIDFKADVLIHYTGSIPAKMQWPTIVWHEGETIFSDYTIMKAYRYSIETEEDIEEITNWPHQVHFCDYIRFEITVHIPQENSLQAKHEEFSFDIDVEQWNDECNDQQTGGNNCIQIYKTLVGAFTDPTDGSDLISGYTDQIALNAQWPTKFALEICIVNCGEEDLTDVVVTDTLGDAFEFIGDTSWLTINNNDFSFTIPSLAPGEATCVTINIQTTEYEDGIYHPITSCLIPIWPLDGDIFDYPGNHNTYEIESPTNNPFYSIKYETVEADGIKDGDYDIFAFTLDQDPGTYEIKLEAKTGDEECIVSVYNVGDTATCNGFIFEFLSKTDNGDGTYTYEFKVTNNDDKGLSHVAIGLPCGVPPDLEFNTGATAVVADTSCGILSATTEGITLDICCVSNGIGTLVPAPPVMTSIAQDDCEV